MKQNLKEIMHKFTIPMINKYLGTIIRYEDMAHEVTGFIAHKDGSRTVIIENQIGSEDFISYQEFLQILYPVTKKSYERIPRP